MLPIFFQKNTFKFPPFFFQIFHRKGYRNSWKIPCFFHQNFNKNSFKILYFFLKSRRKNQRDEEEMRVFIWLFIEIILLSKQGILRKNTDWRLRREINPFVIIYLSAVDYFLPLLMERPGLPHVIKVPKHVTQSVNLP